MFSNFTTLVQRIYRACLSLIQSQKDGIQHFAYVTNQGSNSISQFSVSAHGSLLPLLPAGVSTGTTPVFIAVTALIGHICIFTRGGNSDKNGGCAGRNASREQR